MFHRNIWLEEKIGGYVLSFHRNEWCNGTISSGVISITVKFRNLLDTILQFPGDAEINSA